MTNQQLDVFSGRSTTQDFLFSRSKAPHSMTPDSGTGLGDDNANVQALERDFPDMLDRVGLVQAIETRLASVSKLVAMAVEVKQTDSADEKERLERLDGLCRTNEGIWARTGTHRLACVLPHLSDTEGLKLAEALIASDAKGRQPGMIIGVAAYPTINYTKSQVLDNAEKACDHAAFFGPGNATLFDAVSLNISGDRCYQAGDLGGAIDEFRKGLLLNPTDANLHNSLGVCYGVRGEYDLALLAFEHAIWLAPKEVMPVYNKGCVLSAKGKQEEALACFLEANTKEQDVYEVVFHIGKLFMAQSAFEKARPFLENAVRVNSRSGPALKSLGSCLKQLGLIKEAIQAYKTAVKCDPSDAQSLSELGQLYLQLGQSLDVATVLCNQSVHLDPDNGLYWFRLGCAYLQRDRLDPALKAFEEAEMRGQEARSKIEAVHHRLMNVKAS